MNTVLFSNDSAKADTLNYFFCSVFTRGVENVSEMEDRSGRQELLDTYFTEETVIKHLQKLKISKSSARMDFIHEC